MNWTALNSALSISALVIYVLHLAIDPVTPTILYAQTASNTGEGIFKSTNGGATWTFSNLGSPGLKQSP